MESFSYIIIRRWQTKKFPHKISLMDSVFLLKRKVSKCEKYVNFDRFSDEWLCKKLGYVIRNNDCQFLE